MQRYQENKKKFEKDRKLVQQNQGLKTISSTPKLPELTVGGSHQASSAKYDFPTDKEIEDFQSQLNVASIECLAAAFTDHFTTLRQKISLPLLQKFLNSAFRDKPPAPALVQAIYDRFKPFRLEGYKDSCHVAAESGMDLLDFMLALNLLARIVYDKKLKLIFDLCDDDDDGCMTPEDILLMLQRVERVFAKECARVVLDSSILDNFVADKKAEQNFHLIMGMLFAKDCKKKAIIQKNDDEKQKKAGNSQQAGMPTPVPDRRDEEQDNLITYREFIKATRSLKSLYRRILPRTLAFKDVLRSRKTEAEFAVYDSHADDFAMFRYEINSIFKQHQYKDETPCDLFGGRHPLSKTSLGTQIKDLHENEKKDPAILDKYRPPGIVKFKESRLPVGAAANRAATSLGSLPQHSQSQKVIPKMFMQSDVPNFGNQNVQEKEREFLEKTERQIWQCVPERRIFKRDPVVSDFEARANAKRFEKWETPNRNLDNNSPQRRNRNVKIAGDQARGGDSRILLKPVMKPGLDQFRSQKNLESLYKIKLDYMDPNTVDMELLYQDNLPPETKVLEDFINDFKDKDTKDDVSVQAVKEKAFSNLRQMQNLLPEEGRDWKKISALQFQQFEQENEKYGKPVNKNDPMAKMNAILANASRHH